MINNVDELKEHISNTMPYNLHGHTMYSKSDCGMTAEKYVQTAKNLGAKVICKTDHGTLLGTYEFMQAGQDSDIIVVPGVEAYTCANNQADSLFVRAHQIIVPFDYEGFLAISHAMRDANENLEHTKGNGDLAVMSDAVMEKYFKDNTHVLSTTACIAGSVSQILLHNRHIERKSAKELNSMKVLKQDFEQYKKAAEVFPVCKEKLKEVKAAYKAQEKWIKPGHTKKIARLKKKIETLLPDTDIYKQMNDDLKTAEGKRDNAEKTLMELSKEISELNSIMQQQKDIINTTKKKAESYVKLYKKVSDNYEKRIPDEKLYVMAKERLLYLKSIFPCFYVEMQYHGLEDEAYVMPILLKLADETNTPIIAANDSHLPDNSEDAIEQRRLLRFNYFNKAQEVSDADRELYLKTDLALASALSDVIGTDRAIEAVNNLSVLDKCNVVFPRESHYPKIKTNEKFDDLIELGKHEMIKKGLWNDEYQKRLEKEVDVIKTMGYVDYHLVVRDFCNTGRLLGKIPREMRNLIPENFDEVEEFCKKNHLLEGEGIGPGRGSAAGSLVCYLLGITNIDPIKYSLLFERFLNVERVSMPDIDTDVSTSLRPYVIKYLQWRYGTRAVCSIATVTTYGAKNALQMAGRDRADQLFGHLPNKEAVLKKRQYNAEHTFKISDMIPETPGITLADCEEEFERTLSKEDENKLIWNHAKLIEGLLSGNGVHAGGVIISDNDNVNDYVPLAFNNEKGVWVAQCDMIQAEENGLLKMDLLGLGTLDVITDTLHMIKENRGQSIDIDRIPLEDKDVYTEIYSKGMTNSVFQYESGGMKKMLRSFKPARFEDLILLVAAYRPGPMQYLDGIIKSKNEGKKMPGAASQIPALKPILDPTYGAVVYQEQVMQIFQTLAGYSLGGADLVRRAMSKKKLDKLAHERQAFIYGDADRNIDGCINRNVPEKLANQLFDEMMDFAKYAFNKSHAAAYALVSYQTAWLKFHYPVEFECAMLNNEPQDKYEPVLDDINAFGIRLLPPDINNSQYEHVIENNEYIRYGFKGIKGMGESSVSDIARIKANQNISGRYVRYSSFKNFLIRNKVVKVKQDKNGHKSCTYSVLSDSVLRTYINAGLFDFTNPDRKALCRAYIDDINASSKDAKLEAESPELLDAKIKDVICEYGWADKEYNIRQEMELFGNIISVNPFEGYAGPEDYGCKSIMNASPKEQGSFMGFIIGYDIMKTRKGSDMMIVHMRDQQIKYDVLFFNEAFKNYKDNIAKLVSKVVKVNGSLTENRSVFARDLKVLKPMIKSYRIITKDKDRWEKTTQIMQGWEEKQGSLALTIVHFRNKEGRYFKDDVDSTPWAFTYYVNQSIIDSLAKSGVFN